MREIILDTETTGLDAGDGHRIVEIGCVELFNMIPTGESFHLYLNPERDMPEEAFRVHGLSTAFLADKPLFAQAAEDLLKFIGEAKIVAHNAEFDLQFLNKELDRLGLPLFVKDRVVDTLALARRKFPGATNSLDALCARFGIDTSRRTKHGALLDAELLAEVYAELTGGRQAVLVFAEGRGGEGQGNAVLLSLRPQPLQFRLNAAERAHHRAFVATLGAAAIWHQYCQNIVSVPAKVSA